MRVTALVENRHNCEKELAGEHGLSLYIEYKERKILLDAGATELFAENANKLGLSLEKADTAVLSHAHYDHSGGFEKFFSCNTKAVLYMQSTCGENCWRLSGSLKEKNPALSQNDIDCDGALDGLLQQHLKYIGIPAGLLKRYEKRLRFVTGDFMVAPGVWLISHHLPKLWEKGKAAGMFRFDGKHYFYDDFSHEQSLVLETKQGLAIFNSCCHSGPDLIVEEIKARPCFKGQKIYALFGGFHLKDIPQNGHGRALVEALGRRLAATGVPHFYTGHCTGEWAFEILSGILRERLFYFKTGDQCEWE